MLTCPCRILVIVDRIVGHIDLILMWRVLIRF